MKAIGFPEANVRLTRPDDHKDDRMTPPEAYVGNLPSGKKFFTTMWQPSAADIESMIDGRPIVLQIITETITPVCLFSIDENGKPIDEQV